MKIKKLRGQKRRSKDIQHWIQNNLVYNKQYFSEYNREYCEVIVHPWCDITLGNSIFPEPKRKNRERIVAGLLDIYESWKIELDSIGKEYYLKIWLYDPYVSKSQVVCAIDDKLHSYDNTFIKSNSAKAFEPQNYGCLADRIKQYQWESFKHELTLEDDYVGKLENYQNPKDYIETKKWFSKTLKKPHRTFKVIAYAGERQFNAFPQGTIWVGGK
jgi:hypothetical protein